VNKYKGHPGAKIRDLREQRGWTQTQVAEFTGYSRVYINNLERGRVPNPNVNIIKKLATLFSLTVEQIWK